MRSVIVALCVALVLTSCQSQEDIQQELQRQAEEKAKQEVEKAKASFFDSINHTLDSWKHGVQDWWSGVWGNTPLSNPVTGPISNPTSNNSRYKVGTIGANGRKCARLTCEIIKTFNAGEEIEVSGTSEGDVFHNSNLWLNVLYNNSTIYVHSSLASLKDSSPSTVNIGDKLPATSTKIQASTPYKSQWELYGGNLEKYKGLYKGWNNCGPAAVAMVMAYYKKDISVDDAARQIRNVDPKNPDNDKAFGNTETDFRSTTSATGPNTIALLDKNGLKLINVSSFDDVKAQLDLPEPRPVIILVHNIEYFRKDEKLGRNVPYPNAGGFAQYTVIDEKTQEKTVLPVNHIVVVTGYDATNVYINDPLAVKIEKGSAVSDPYVGKDFAIDIETFKLAAGAVGWYGAAVAPK